VTLKSELEVTQDHSSLGAVSYSPSNYGSILHAFPRQSEILELICICFVRKMTSNSGHCIHRLLPSTKVLPMKLRDSHCVFALPQCHYNLYKHSFVLRNLFVSAY